MWVIAGLLSAIFAALLSVIGKIALRNLDPIALTALRSIIMAIIIVTVAFITGSFAEFNLNKLSKGQIIAIILASIAGATSWVFYFIGLKLTPKVTAMVALDRSSVLFTILLSFLILHQQISVRTIIGGILIFLGIILMQ